MTYRQLVLGGTVYHAVFAHWGSGRVEKYRERDALGYPTTRKVLVRWAALPADRTNPAWVRLSELRTTPAVKEVTK